MDERQNSDLLKTIPKPYSNCTVADRFLSDPDREAAGRVMQAMMELGKLDIAALEAAFTRKGETT